MNFDTTHTTKLARSFAEPPKNTQTPVPINHPIHDNREPIFQVSAEETNQERFKEIEAIENQIHTFQLQEPTTLEEQPTVNTGQHSVIKVSLAAIPVLCLIGLIASVLYINKLKAVKPQPQAYPAIPTTLPTALPTHDPNASPSATQNLKANYPGAYHVRNLGNLGFDVFYQGKITKIQTETDQNLTVTLKIEKTGEEITLKVSDVSSLGEQANTKFSDLYAKDYQLVDFKVRLDPKRQFVEWELLNGSISK